MDTVGTTRFAARRQLLKVFKEEHDLGDGVIVDYFDNESHESVTLGPTIDQDTTELTATTGAPVVYVETYEIDVVIWVSSQSTVGESEERAEQISDAVYRCLRNDPRIGCDGDNGFIRATVIRAGLLSGEVLNQGAATRLDLTVECKARIAAK